MKEEVRIKRFWANINISGEDECWEWLKSTQDGYGRTSFRGITTMAHRIAFQLHHNRDIETGKILLHSCDNRKCCNVKHLREGTHKDNSDDKFAKGRFKPMKGEMNGMAKLNIQKAIEIREKYATGKYTQSKLAQEYNVGQTDISMVILNKRWLET